MNNSGQEKQDQRTSSGMEDSTAITIEFLRARLLSERSVSGSARERADELAKRVAELEEQLRIMSLQRMKAEKATADVLAILESNGISDESEMFDPNSDQDTPCESKVGKKTFKEEESSVHSKVTKYKLEEHSGTDHDISSAQGRSLSWKCRKHSPRSLEKCKDPSLRRRSSFASTSSSPKHHQGKSRRQIRSKESRSTTEAFRASPDKVDSPENGVATTSEVFPNCSEPEARGIENGEEKALPPISDGLENGQHADSNELEDDVYGSDRDMEKALEHQAQLIDRYEAMEKAQREWEEKFRENNGSTPDSYDLGNRSDVTEEGYEIKAQAAPHDGTVAAQSNGAKLEVENASNIQPNGILPPSHVNTGQLQEWKSSSTPASESSAQDFAFHAEKQKQNQESLGNNYHPSLHSFHHHPHSHSSHDSPGSQFAASFPSNTDSGFSKGQSASNIQPNGILPPSHVNTGQLQEWKSSSTPASGSSAQDFAFHAEKQKQNQESLGNNYHPSLHSSHHHPHSHSPHDSPGSQSAASFPSNTDSGFRKGQSAYNIQPNGILPPSHVNTGQLQEWKSSSTPASESSAQDFAFHAEKQKQNQESLGNNYRPSLHSSHHHPHSHSSHDSPGSQSAASFPSNTDSGFSKGQASGRQNDLYALVPHRASNELGGVLDALKQARQSLRQRIGTLPLIEGGSIRNSVNPSLPPPIPGDKVDIPLGNVGLFRLPTDFLVEGSARTNLLSSNARLSLGNYYPDTGVPAAASNRFVSRSYSATGSRFPAEDRFLASQYVEGGSRVSSQRPFFYPYVDTVLPPSGRYTYPTNPSYPDQIPPLPSREPPSFLPSRTTGVPPADHFSFSDHHIRPNMYR